VTRRIVGEAGAALADAPWAANREVAAIGRVGERRTAEILDRLASDSTEDGRRVVTVLHDLKIPLSRITANIDHVVVAGGAIYLVDSKAWKPGFYVTIAGHTYRSFQRFEHADKKTMEMARQAVDGYLKNRGVKATVTGSTVVVWPTNGHSRLRLALLRVPGARPMSGESLARRSRSLFRPHPGDHDRIVAELGRLVNGTRRT